MMRTCDRTPLGCRGLCASERRKSRDLPGTMRRHTVMNRPINSASSCRRPATSPTGGRLAGDAAGLWQQLESRRHEPPLTHLAGDPRPSHRVAQAFVPMGVAVVVDTCSVNEVALAIHPHREVAALAGHRKLALTARCFNNARFDHGEARLDG